jgi:hypothetical protein
VPRWARVQANVIARIGRRRWSALRRELDRLTAAAGE